MLEQQVTWLYLAVVFPLKKLTEQGIMSADCFLGVEREGVNLEQSSCCCFLQRGVRGIWSKKVFGQLFPFV